MSRFDKTLVWLTVAFVVLMVADFLLPEWVRFIGLQTLARGAVALGLLVLWRTGLVSFGHALFFGWGAYAAALMSREGITDAFVLVIGATLAAGLLAFLLGFLLRRYRAIFFALLNLAFSMILYGVLVKTEELGSTDGFGVAKPTFLGYAPDGEAVQITLFAFTVTLTYLVVVGVHLYLKSTLGHMTMAIRGSEAAVARLQQEIEDLETHVSREYHDEHVLHMAGLAERNKIRRARRRWMVVKNAIDAKRIALYWQEQTQCNLCAAGGAGRAADAAAFHEEF